ncbi:MAG: NlpC/P60 family protein [Atopobiaceae bacterium]|nr:NlpC/P60 family protein [Atopobiaceae bacterium]
MPPRRPPPTRRRPPTPPRPTRPPPPTRPPRSPTPPLTPRRRPPPRPRPTVTTQAYRDQWVQEGSRWYYYDASGSRASGWVVNSTFKTYGLQRYWLDTTTKALASSELVKASEAGYWAYATRYGYVVRGRYTEGGVTYLADNDGRLESPGWHVSSAYGQGLQRYYVDSTKHGCTDGYSADGYAHYTTSAGYVLRGHLTSGTVTYLADNDGRLATSEGWHVSTAYGQGLQRYYVTAASHGCVTGYSTAGWAHYTTPAGYVLRGHLTSGTVTYLADNDGRLATSEGWLVSSAYGQGLQRYYVTAAKHGCVTGYSTAGWAHYTTPAGYVLRGHLTSGTVTYLADNDGRLATSEGWHVSSAYGQGLQRYYVTAAKHGCVTGYSAAGWAHYTTSAGYVLRGHLTSGTVTYLADNDGRLATSEGWHVSSAYGQGLQRYYVTAAKHGCVTGLSTAGYGHYTTSEGYVLRGKYGWNGYGLLADNDGRLETTSGWVVTGKYDGGTLQRYYMVNASGNIKGSKLGYFTVGSTPYYGLYDALYVSRNGTFYGNGHVYQTNNDGVGTLAPRSYVISYYVNWALGIASDDSHGYDQENRWGPDYDCSSLVISALDAAGIDTNGATYTGNMRSCLTAAGFVWLSAGTSLQYGDILLNECRHTAIYIQDGMIVQASGNENGGVTGGKTGDQTGREILTRTYYSYPWDGILRYVA